MAVLSSLSVSVELDEVNGQFIFTDLIGSDYNAVYGYALASILGLIKITGSQSGIVYKNPGWDSDDYSHPDITSLLWEKTISGVIPIGSDGLIVRQFYTVEYKISVDTGASTFLSFLQIFQNVYSRASISVTSLVSLVDSTLILTDATDYTLSASQNYSPTSFSRQFNITWPTGSAIANTVSSNAVVQLGADIWSGNYDIEITVNVSYLLVSAVNGLTVSVTDEIIETLHRIVVVYQDFTGLVNQALIQLTTTYESYKSYNLPYAEKYQLILEDLMMYYDMFKMANISGTDMSYAMTQIYDILSNPELGISVVLKVAEIVPNPSTQIYQNATIVGPIPYQAQTDGVTTFNIPELVGGIPMWVFRGTQPIMEGTGKDFTYNITTGDVTMNAGKALGLYETLLFWISKTIV